MVAADLDPARQLLVVGVNQRSAGPAARERLFQAEPDAARLLAALRLTGPGEAMVLATCERIELIAFMADPAEAERSLVRALTDRVGLTADDLEGQTFRRQGAEALRHIFAVAASLDSEVVGEPQILGQVKDCHRQAVAAGLAGSGLELVLQAAYGAAKRVRSETPIAQQPVSIAASALLVARDIHGDLDRRDALLIGLGEMGEFLASEFRDAGLRGLVITHPSQLRAESAARRLGCHFRPWEELAEAVTGADIVIGGLGAGNFVVTRGLAEAALKQRRREPIFFIDAAVPGDIEPAVDMLDGAFVYTLADLEQVALKGKATREAASTAAWKILEEELAAFLRQRAERAAVPTVAALREHFEAIRAGVLAGRKLDAEEATRLLVKRLLHDPSEVLRGTAAEETDPAETNPLSLEAALRRLFRLDGAPRKARGRPPGEENDT